MSLERFPNVFPLLVRHFFLERDLHSATVYDDYKEIKKNESGSSYKVIIVVPYNIPCDETTACKRAV